MFGVLFERGFFRTYIASIRSIPLVLVLFWFFFLVPILLGHLIGGRSTADPRSHG
jgi:ABC-type amino acid transport system permease subunit